MKNLIKALLSIFIICSCNNATAEVITVGSAATCNMNNLQLALDQVMNNNDEINEIRLVDDGAFNHQSFIVDFTQHQELQIIGGFTTCADANNNLVTAKTTLDAQDTEVTESIITISSELVREFVNGRNLPIVKLENLILKNSRAIKGAALIIDGIEDAIIRNSDLIANSAENGGALYCQAITILKIYDSFFNNNNASNNGGAIYLGNNGEGNVVNSGCYTVFHSENNQTQISNNTAGNNGGGIYTSDFNFDLLFSEHSANLNLSGLIISDNSATNGGGIYHTTGISLLDDTKFLNNHAIQRGGAAYVGDGSGQSNGNGISLEKTEIAYNTAGVSGGAFFIQSSTVNITPTRSSSSSIHHNSAPIAAVAEIGVNGGFRLGDSQLNRLPTFISEHHNAEALIYAHTSGLFFNVDNAIFTNNSNINFLIKATQQSLWMLNTVISHNQVNNSLIKISDIVQTFDNYLFLNTFNNNIFIDHAIEIDNAKYFIKNNIIWEDNTSLLSLSNSTGFYDCNIVSSQESAFDGTRNTVIDPQFVNPEHKNFNLSFASPAIDYCSHSNLLNGEDLFDWPQIDNRYGVVDIGAKPYIDAIFKNFFDSI